VTEKGTGKNITGALATIKGTSFAGTSATNGSLRIAGLPPGTYNVTITAKGYKPFTRTVAIGPGAETVLDVALEKEATGGGGGSPAGAIVGISVILIIVAAAAYFIMRRSGKGERGPRTVAEIPPPAEAGGVSRSSLPSSPPRLKGQGVFANFVKPPEFTSHPSILGTEEPPRGPPPPPAADKVAKPVARPPEDSTPESGKAANTLGESGPPSIPPPESPK
jgi:hypothetical protein